jgi:hypothetical protein
MITDPLRPTTNFGVWWVTCEYNDAEDNSLIDFSTYDNIQVTLEDPFTRSVVMTLTRGVITTPARGIIEWYVQRNQMGALREGTYHVTMEVWNGNRNDAIALMDSSVSIVGNRVQ